MTKENKVFFVQEEMKLIEMKPIKIAEYNIDIPEIYGFDFMKQMDENIISFFDEIGDYDNPILFQLIGEFDLLDVANEEDKISFIVGVISIFTGNMIKKGTSTGRGRFAAPKDLDNLRISNMVKRDLVNREVRFPIFSLEILDTNGNLVYEVM